MFFELHEENRIGYKVLSRADLGIGESSHQTHIGLSEHVLTFLPDRDKISEDSIFIYEGKFDYIDAYFDRIENPDGSFRSPKIRIGDRSCVSIVSTIRDIVAGADENSATWYLLWFGLKSEKIVFFLFNNLSSDYKNIEMIGLKFDKEGARSIYSNNPSFDALMRYIENKINKNGINQLKNLEVETQTQNLLPSKRFKKYDIDKANENFKEIGRTGERLVDIFLEDKVKQGQLATYTWYNRDAESGLPYDFTAQDSHANVFYFDVKTTNYDFKQKMIFSTQEIDFIANNQNKYCIYRLYKDEQDRYFLRICENCKDLTKKIWIHTTQFSDNLNELQIQLKSAKLAISPEIASLKFNAEIPIQDS